MLKCNQIPRTLLSCIALTLAFNVFVFHDTISAIKQILSPCKLINDNIFHLVVSLS